MTKQTYRTNNRSNNTQNHRNAGEHSREETANEKKRPTLIAYQVKNTGEDQTFWTAIGAAWLNKDNFSFSLTLDAIPTDGRIQLYPPKEQEAG